MNALPMILTHIFDWLESWPFSEAVRQSAWLFPTIESVHVVAITLVIGSVLVVDLRVLGVASRRQPVSRLSRDVLPWTWGLFGLALISGGLMFAAKAHAYAGNTPFRLKMLLMAAAGMNMLLFHVVPSRSLTQWDLGPTPRLARICCGLSLALWVLIVTCGRWIGFTIEG